MQINMPFYTKESAPQDYRILGTFGWRNGPETAVLPCSRYGTLQIAKFQSVHRTLAILCTVKTWILDGVMEENMKY